MIIENLDGCHSCFLYPENFQILYANWFFGHNHMQWITFLDSEGRVTDSEAMRKRIFYGGLDHELRKEVCILHL